MIMLLLIVCLLLLFIIMVICKGDCLLLCFCGVVWVCGYDYEKLMVIIVYGFVMLVK